MAAGGGGGTIGSLQLNHNLNYVFTSSVDHQTSLILSQFSHNNSNQPPYNSLQSSTTFMQRGPRYEAYAALRESKLRMKQSSSIQEKEKEEEEEEDQEEGFNFNFKLINSQKKHVKSPGNSNSITHQQQQQQQKRSKGPSSVSVPDFASPIKRENRRSAPPPAMINDQNPKTMRSKSGTYDGIMGRKSVEKKSNGTVGGGFMARKSYAGLEVLKGLGCQARRAINGGGESNAMRSIPRKNCNFDRSEFAYSTHF